jgi:hypothetical protein
MVSRDHSAIGTEAIGVASGSEDQTIRLGLG